MTNVQIVIALLLAFTGMVVLAPIYITLLQRLGFGKQIRLEGPESHYGKAGTPTMGGMLIVGVVLFLAMALRIEDHGTLTPLLTLVGVGILGAIDDFVNVRTGIGMRGRWKLVWQTVVAILAAFYIWNHFNLTGINVPFVGQFEIAPVLLIAFIAFVIVGTSNAVNLTDGLDGLAGGVLIFSFVAYLLISLVEIEGLKLAQPQPRHLLRPRHRRADGVPLVQRAPGDDHHGRLRSVEPRGDAGGGRHRQRPAAAACHRRDRLLRGDHERRDPGRQLPAAWPEDLPHDAAPPPLRAHRLGGGEDHGPLLDRGGAGRAARREHLPARRERALAGPMMTAPRTPIRTVDDLRGRRTAVLGLARSGVAACRFLADAGAVVVAYDRRPASELVAEVASLGARPVRLALGVDEASAVALLAHADLLVTSPSISPRFPTTDRWLRDALIAAEARGAELVSEVDLFLRLTRARILGVTGTKGKTTTASLVAAMLERGGVPSVLGGNIGTPLIERATELGPDDWAVLELSELQLPTISRGADVALYTNIGEDHLDRHGTVAAYQAVKARLAELSAPGGRVVLNNDDAGCRALGDRLSPASVAWYGREEPARGRTEAWLDDEGWIRLAGERLLPAGDVRLPGRHMLSNVIGASLAASLVGVPALAIGEAIAAFEGVPHRLELIGERGGVRWINDSQATIPVAAMSALEAFDAPIVLISGGQGKGLAYGDFAEAIVEHARAAILIGETADELASLIGDRVPVERARDMPAAVAAAAGLAQPGDVVLLAPAAASFDMYTDYAERGDAFRAAFDELGEGR